MKFEVLFPLISIPFVILIYAPVHRKQIEAPIRFIPEEDATILYVTYAIVALACLTFAFRFWINWAAARAFIVGPCNTFCEYLMTFVFYAMQAIYMATLIVAAIYFGIKTVAGINKPEEETKNTFWGTVFLFISTAAVYGK